MKKRYILPLALACSGIGTTQASTIFDLTSPIDQGALGTGGAYLVHSGVATIGGVVVDLVVTSTGVFDGDEAVGGGAGLGQINVDTTTVDLVFSIYEAGTFDSTTNMGTLFTVPTFSFSLYDIDGNGRETISLDEATVDGSVTVDHVGSGLTTPDPTGTDFEHIWSNNGEVTNNPSNVNFLQDVHVNNSVQLTFTNTSQFTLNASTTHSRAVFYSGVAIPEPSGVLLASLSLGALCLKRKRD